DHSAVLFASKRGSVRRNSSVGVEMAESTRTSKLMYANVDASDVSFVAPIMSLSFPDALCLVTTTQLSIGTIDPVQKLHIRNTPLPKWAAPHRVVHNVAHGTFGVATVHAIGGTPAATSLATWEALGPAETNEQQMKMLGDVRAPLVSSPPVEAGRFSVINAQTMEVQSTLLLRPYELPESLCVAPALMCLERTGKAAMEVDGGGGLENVFVLGTSIVMPNEDDAHRGRILVMQWDAQMQRTRIIGSFTTHGAVYALRVFRGMLLAAVNNRLLLLGWQRRTHKLASNTRMGREGDRFVTAEDAEYELVVLYSQQTQIVTVSLTVSGDYVAAGDLMSSVSVYRYEENLVDDKVERRMTPVTRDYAAAWVSAVATAPGPLVQNLERVFPDRIPDEVEMAGRVKIGEYSRVFQDPGTERFVVADSFNNLYRVARAASNGGGGGGGQQDGQQDQRLAVEGRWHLGDMVNCIRPGSLVMDIPDPEFPELFRPLLVYGTIMGAVGVVASVEDGKLGRILDRLQTNLAHLVPTPGMWSYDRWRGYQTNQRQTRAFGFLDGDLIERLLDLSPHVQMLVVTGGSALLGESQVDRAEWRMKSRSCAGFARVEGECDVEILGCQAVSNIVKREGVSVEYVVRLVESLSRLH
ncbi:DNA damage-binding protein 1a, partial [Linderina macrospora]